MRVVVFGASGAIGGCVTRELVRRGHTVKVVAQVGAPASPPKAPLIGVVAEVTNPSSVSEAVRGADAVISAIGPRKGQPPSVLTAAARGLLHGLHQAGVSRLVVVGGAGSLEVAPGVQLLDTPSFPPEGKPVAEAHRAALEIYRADPEIEWTVISPAAIVEPGTRSGHYRAGAEQLLVDGRGESRISTEDYAVAVVDELETPRHIRRRFVVVAA